MSLFRYVARDTNGQKKTDFISAFNAEKARSELNNKGYTVNSLKGPDSIEMKVLNAINPVGTKDLVVFSRQFSVMVSANLPVVTALGIIVEQTENIKLKMEISEIIFEVDAGSRLSEALAERTHIFSQFYINVIRSGETSGKLDEVLSYLADEMEKDYNIISKIRGAMIYPVFVLGGLVVVGLIMMVYVLPKLTVILERSDAKLPLSTRIIISISDFLSAYWWLLAILLVLVFFGVRFLIKHNSLARNWFDLFKIKMPIFGKLFQNIYIVRFTRSMQTLIVSGITITRSLQIVAEVVGNNVYKELLQDTLAEVEEGNSISSVLSDSDKVPSMVPQMIGVGEKTGKLDIVLEKITEFYESEINKTVDNLVSIMEPLIIVVLGVGVGIMIAAILMPMYDMATQI